MILRIFLFALALTVVVAAVPRAVRADTRIAIIDTAFDTRPHLDALHARGVRVIGRYYARCPQTELGAWLGAKRLIDQGGLQDAASEIRQMAARGIAVLSIYQYYSNHPNKFSGRTRDGKALPDASCDWSRATPRSVTEEARLDADAAVSQARALGQPPGTAIYFGVDFNLQPDDTALQRDVVAYFRTVRAVLKAAGYRVGAYGSGLTLDLLRRTPNDSGTPGLTDFSWIMASASFAGTQPFHRAMNWHLFQNQVDREWFGAPQGGRCTRGLPVDTNVQNGYVQPDVGFWLPGQGAFAVAYPRTWAIYEARRFACDGDALVRAGQSSGAAELTAKTVCAGGQSQSVGTRIPYAGAVRIDLGSASGGVVQVDTDDDGTWDGWTALSNLTGDFRDKPAYIFDPGRRAAARCR